MLFKVIVVGAVGYVAWRWHVKRVDREAAEYHREQLTPQRRFAWEDGLSVAEETALLRGIAAYEAAGSHCSVHHEKALLDVGLGTSTIISLFRLAEQFRALGAPALADPIAAVKSLLDGIGSGSVPGGLRLQRDWFTGELDSMNNDRFIDAARELLRVNDDERICSWYSDENEGRIDLEISADRAALASIHGGDYEKARAHRSRHVNVLVIDVGLAVAPYRQLRAAQPTLPPKEVLRRVLIALIQPGSAAILWSKVTASEREWAVALAAASGQKLAA